MEGGGNPAAPWRRQGSSGSGGTGSAPTTPAPAPAPPAISIAPSTGGSAPPPPPPLMSPGSMPSVRLSSEVGPLPKGPPKALQGAMMKDKKPFTYTPGGIDLSEIRSPRMAKRIQMNAAAEGVTSVPQQNNASGCPGGPPHLPPAALAAMQPQLPIAVFPQGGFNPGNLNRTFRPTEFVSGQNGHQQNQFPPPPPPPPQSSQNLDESSNRQGNANTNHTETSAAPSSITNPPKSLASFMNQSVRPVSPSAPVSQVNPPSQFQPPPPPPLAPQQFQPPPPPQQFQAQLRQQFQPQTQEQFQPQPQPQPQQQHFQRPAQQPQRQPLPHQQTKAQTVSQNIGSIYIPPLETKQEQQPSIAAPAANSAIASGTGRSNSFEKEPERDKSSSNTPQTPQLNKAPVPWMNSHNRMQNQVQNSPPIFGNASTPWGTLTSGQARTIPIAIARDDDDVDTTKAPTSQQHQQQNTPRAPPFLIKMSNNVGGQGPSANGARMIPIQMEGNVQRIRFPPTGGQSVPQTPQSAGVTIPIRQVGPTPYNNPNVYSPQAAQEAYKQMQQEPGDLQSGINKISIDDESPRPEPTQSKSFRVLQKITADADDVDEGSSLHNTSEPRFRGSSIPSKAFRTLQNNLPPCPDNPDQGSSPVQQQQQQRGVVGHPVTHTIKIQMPEKSSEQQQQQQPQQKQQRWVPASQQKVPEPKMYMGGNIPSRSFKMLQAMTGEIDDHQTGAALGSDVGPDQSNVNSSSSSSAEIPYDPNSSLDPNTFAFVDNEGNYLCVPPENYNDQSFNWEDLDLYTYWWYWWYCANYWAANGIPVEYPEGWEYPPCCEEDENINESPSDDVYIPSKSFRNLQKSLDNNNGELETPNNNNVPKIIIENRGESQSPTKKRTCDQIGLRNGKKDLKFLPSIRETEVGLKNEETEEDESANECESYYSSSGSCWENEGVVDEPETPSSEDDTSTITDEIQPLQIEECFSSEPESSKSSKRLSTIDELSENELSISRNVNLGNISVNLLSEDDENESSESESSSSSSDEDNSSASVIENKSGEYDTSAMTTTASASTTPAMENGEGKENDDYSSCNEVDEGDDEDFEQSTVTVRLPLKLSFGKSKSYRDIATVLVGDSEIETKEGSGKSTSGRKKSLMENEEEEEKSSSTRGILNIRETSEESSSNSSSPHATTPAVSYTITLSHSDPKTKETNGAECNEGLETEDATVMEGLDLENVSGGEEEESQMGLNIDAVDTQSSEVNDVDFWGEIINKSSSASEPLVDTTVKKLEIDSKTDNEEEGTWVETEAESEMEMETDLETDDATDTTAQEVTKISKSQSIDFWKEIVGEPSSCTKAPEINFWEKQEIRVNRFNFIESHRSFELTPDYHRDVEKAKQLLIDQDPDEKAADDNQSQSQCREMSGLEHQVESKSIISGAEFEKSELTVAEENDYDEENDDYGGAGVTEASSTGIEDEGDKRNEVVEDNNSPRFLEDEERRNSSSKNRKGSNSFRPVESPANLSVSDETSDESSSTIGATEKVGVAIPGTLGNGEGSTQTPVAPAQVPIKQINENSPSDPPTCPHQTNEMGKTMPADRIAKAESLLWRIERFLQESLCLGSEDDSGIMTDVSRPISECETDYDAENEVGVAIVKTQKKSPNCNMCSKTEISEHKVSTTQVTETTTKTTEEKVTLRGNTGTTGRKAWSYQRAKTHSRLFQLLQEECGREGDEENEEGTITFVEKTVEVEIENEMKNPPRSRLMTPLPINTNFQSTDSNSTSSLSGSSGVLSPTSPAQRDQLLADIINEFHLRVSDSSRKSIRNVNFPSKIFKLLQEEFGEEFYDTFHSGEDIFQLSLPPQLMNGQTTNTNTKNEQVQEISLQKETESLTKETRISHKRNYTKLKQNATGTAKLNKVDHLDVPFRI